MPCTPRIIFLFVMLFAFNLSVQTQDDRIWPPEPNTIFAEGVNWELVDLADQAVSVHFDNRVIRLTIGNNYLEYDFPPEADNLYYADFLVDGRVWAGRSDDGIGDPDDFWVLDPDTGTYTRPDMMCNDRVVVGLQSPEDPWHILGEDETFLCHIVTGEMRDLTLPEPSEPLAPIDPSNWRVYPTPDPGYLLITNDGDTFCGFNCKLWFLSYNLETDELLLLGYGFVDHTLMSSCGWINNTQGIICLIDVTRSYDIYLYFGFDITQAGSFLHLTSAWPENVFSLDTLPGYVSAHTNALISSRTGSRSPVHTPCTLTVFDAVEVTEIELGYECLPVVKKRVDVTPFHLNGDIVYYLTVDSDDATVSTLSNYDVGRSVGNIPMLTGPFESILSVSPDQRYIVLLMDDNATFDLLWDRSFCCEKQGGWRVAIYDWHRSRFAYVSELMGTFSGDHVAWLDNETIVIGAMPTTRTLVLSDDVSHRVDILGSLRRLHFTDGELTDIEVTYDYALENELFYDRDMIDASVDGYWLREDYTLVDLHTFSTVPLFIPDVADVHNLRAQWLDNGDLEVQINPYSRLSVTYHVTMP